MASEKSQEKSQEKSKETRGVASAAAGSVGGGGGGSEPDIAVLESTAAACEAKSDWTALSRTLEVLRARYYRLIEAERKLVPELAAAATVAAPPTAAAGSATAAPAPVTTAPVAAGGAAPAASAAPAMNPMLAAAAAASSPKPVVAAAAAAATATPSVAAVVTSAVDVSSRAGSSALSAAIARYRSALKRLGVAYKYDHDASNALRVFDVIAKFERSLGGTRDFNPALELAALSNSGLVWEDLKEYDKALAVYQELRACEERLGDPLSIATAYMNLALIYRRKAQWTAAIDWAEKSAVLRKREGDFQGLGISYHSLGAIYFSRSQLPQALYYYEKSAAIECATLGLQPLAPSTLNAAAAPAATASTATPAAGATTPPSGDVANKKTPEANTKTPDAAPVATAAPAAVGGANAATDAAAAPVAAAAATVAGAASSAAVAPVGASASVLSADVLPGVSTDPKVRVSSTLSLSGTYHNMGVVLTRLRDPLRAMRAYDASIRLSLSLSDPAQGLAAAAAAAGNAASADEELVSTYQAFARLLFEHDCYAAVAEVFERILRVELRTAQGQPSFAAGEVYTNMGLAYEAALDFPAALAAYDNAARIYTAVSKTGASSAAVRAFLSATQQSVAMVKQRTGDAEQLLALAGDALAGDARKALKALQLNDNDVDGTVNWLLEDSKSAKAMVEKSLAASDAHATLFRETCGKDFARWLAALPPNSFATKLLFTNKKPAGAEGKSSADTAGSGSSRATGGGDGGGDDADTHDIGVGGDDEFEDPDIAAAIAASLK